DSQRPLTAQGAKRFRRAARGLRRIVPAVDLVLSSPYPRAWQTAEILHDEAGWPAPEAADELAAARPPEAALELLKGGNGSLAFVGHEPNLSSLVSLLLTGNAHDARLELKKGGVVFLVCEEGQATGAILRWAVSPKILRALDVGGG